MPALAAGLPERFPNTALHEYVVMPNHFHAILEIIPVVVVGAALVAALPLTAPPTTINPDADMGMGANAPDDPDAGIGVGTNAPATPDDPDADIEMGTNAPTTPDDPDAGVRAATRAASVPGDPDAGVRAATRAASVPGDPDAGVRAATRAAPTGSIQWQIVAFLEKHPYFGWAQTGIVSIEWTKPLHERQI